MDILFLFREPVVLLGPHGRPLSTINEEAASQGSPGVNRRAAAPRSNLLEPSSLVKAINQTSNGGERKPKRSLFKRSGTKDSDLLQVAEDHAANSKPKKKISTKEEKEAQRAAKKHHNELMKHINSQKKLFKVREKGGGGEANIWPCMCISSVSSIACWCVAVAFVPL